VLEGKEGRTTFYTLLEDQEEAEFPNGPTESHSHPWEGSHVGRFTGDRERCLMGGPGGLFCPLGGDCGWACRTT
jgi:hypothetical protein